MDRERMALHALNEEVHWWFTARRKIVRSVLNQVLPPSRDRLVIEVGCGAGGNIAAFDEDYRTVGIDPSPDAIEFAGERWQGPEFIRGYAPEGLGDRVAEADAVLLLDVIEHVEDDYELLSKLFAVTRPGTKFLITVPADESLWCSHDVVHEHYRRYDHARLERTWEGLPVECQLLTSFNTRLYPVVRSIRRASQRSGTSHGPGGTDLKIPAKPVNWALKSIFAGEAPRLVRELESGAGSRKPSVSLMAVLERGPGEIVPRTKPADERPDRHDPVRAAA